MAQQHAETEFEKYKIVQDRLFLSDYDRYLLELEVKSIKQFEKGLFSFIDEKYPEIPGNIRDDKAISDETEELLKKALDESLEEFKAL